MNRQRNLFGAGYSSRVSRLSSVVHFHEENIENKTYRSVAEDVHINVIKVEFGMQPPLMILEEKNLQRQTEIMDCTGFIAKKLKSINREYYNELLEKRRCFHIIIRRETSNTATNSSSHFERISKWWMSIF